MTDKKMPLNASAAPANARAESTIGGTKLTFTQVSSILNELVKQARGQNVPVAVDTSSFVAQADTFAKLLNNQAIEALSATLTRRIFSSRPYTPIFSGLMKTEEEWGAITEKYSVYDYIAYDNPAYEIQTGDKLGDWVLVLPEILRTVIVGGGTYEKIISFSSAAYKTGLRGPEDFARFTQMYVSKFKNGMAQEAEALGRFTVNNLIAAVNQTGRPEQKIHLISEYNAENGTTLDSISVMHPDNYVAFVLWVMARIQTLYDMLAIYGEGYHVSPDLGKNLKLNRHTPRNMARMYTLSKWSRNVENRVLPTLFDGEKLHIFDSEVIPYWQSPGKPDQIIVTPSTIDAAGHKITGTQQTLNNVFGVIMDVEAAGAAFIHQSAAPTPYDPHLEAWSEYYHYTKKFYNDLTENVVILFMD